MQELLEAVRAVCPSALWSQGVKLARENAVVQQTRSAEQAVVRVRSAAAVIAPTVVLYLEDNEWACDCDSRFDACAHVAAAVIALQQGTLGSAGQGEVNSTPPEPQLSYRFARSALRMTLARVIVHADGREEPLQSSLTSALARRAAVATPTHADLAIDRILASPSFRDGLRFADILKQLTGAHDVRLDGAQVSVSEEPLLPLASVSDDGSAVVLRVDPVADVEVLAWGVARVATTLRPLGALEIAGGRWDKIPLQRRFASGELAELVNEVLPKLQRELPVNIVSRRLPSSSGRCPPRVHFELLQEQERLVVLPTLVYGDPPLARIDAGRLVHLQGGIPPRNLALETELTFKLRERLNLVPGHRTAFCGEDAVLFASRLKQWASSERQLLGLDLSQRELLPLMQLDGSRFDFVFQTEPDAQGQRQTADGAAVARAWRMGLELAPLQGGGWAPLPLDWLNRFGAQLLGLLAARDKDGALPRAASIELGRFCEALNQAPPPDFARLKALLEGPESLALAPLPQDLTAVLRPYQRQGVNWLTLLRDAELGALLADDMGLGKTLQALCAFKGRCLVVCPRSVVYNWQAEIRKFRPELSVALYGGPGRALDPNVDVTLVTYGILRLDQERLAAVTWDVVLLDEAQVIKNATSQVAQAAYTLQARFRISLSGTPVENKLEELWSQFQFTNPGLLGGRDDFQARFAQPIYAGDAQASERLRQVIRPFLLRRLKREVLPELPARTEALLHVELDEQERRLYDAIAAATQKTVVEQLDAGGSVLAALEALLRLRQAACHSALVPGQTRERSSKVIRLRHALEDVVADGHKALVFSQWTSLLDKVEPELQAAGIEFLRLDGSTQDRGQVVERFQSEAGAPVLLISLKAGGTGLNLTAADHVFLLDPWWNPAAEDQAADRAHRIGQTRPVLVYRLVAKDTVEERILELQTRKRAIADAAIGEGGAVPALSRSELLALLVG